MSHCPTLIHTHIIVLVLQPENLSFHFLLKHLGSIITNKIQYSFFGEERHRTGPETVRVRKLKRGDNLNKYQSARQTDEV